MLCAKLILVAAVLMLITVSPAQQDGAGTPRMSMQSSNFDYEAYRQAAIRMNDLAGHIQSLDDSRALVDMIAKMFADDLPPGWVTQSIADRVARAEYESATDTAKLIPEQRIADAWNKYVREIGASDEALVNVAEIHNLRDGYYAGARPLWDRGYPNVWAMPNIYAVGADGKVANGSRAVEAIRLIWDLANMFDNLRGARERVRQGVLVSEQLKQVRERQASGTARSEVRIEARVQDNPVETAERRYVQEHGIVRFGEVLDGLVGDLFPSQTGR